MIFDQSVTTYIGGSVSKASGGVLFVGFAFVCEMLCFFVFCFLFFVFCFLFFFFKQKTAYEIRNCDWSSDVCSSDLAEISR